MALRLGNVQGQSIDEVLHLTAARRDKTVQWLHPTRPVLCKLGASGVHLSKDEPAATNQLTRFLAEAGPKAGILPALKSHDIRRGFFRDSANLPEAINGAASAAVAQLGGHSVSAYASGVTQLYTGDIAEDIWSKRVANDFIDEFGVATLDDRYSKRRKLKPAQVDQLCEKENLDPADHKNRVNVLNKYHKNERQNRAFAAPDGLVEDASHSTGACKTP